jgi:hypothetical protein
MRRTLTQPTQLLDPHALVAFVSLAAAFVPIRRNVLTNPILALRAN